MNTFLERSAVIAGLLVLLASVQFGVSIAGATAALIGALLLAIAASLLWLRFQLPATPVWLPTALIAAAIFTGTLIPELVLRSDFAEWFTVVFATLGSGLTFVIVLRNRVRCNLCNRRLSAQALSFRCPRCIQNVCEETCWSFEHRRCQLCLEQRVPILPTESGWWSKATGPRTLQGRCQVCLAVAEKVDLRACPNCRRPQCRECWDFNNGDCQRCGTSLPNLPASLSALLNPGFNAERS